MNAANKFACFMMLFALCGPSITKAADGGYQKPEVGDVPEAGEARLPEIKKVTYVGITAKEVDDTLRAQLNLPDGVGLTVTTVDHKGPASADIQPNDVLQKLDDQLLIDSHQLVTLIRLHKPGDTVTLTLIREAKPLAVQIKLGEKEIHTTAGDANHVSDLTDPRLPTDPFPQTPFDVHIPQVNSQVAMSFKDDVYTAAIRTDAQGHKHMTVKNTAGTVVADGPCDTQEEWNKFSPDVRQHLELMHKMLTDQGK